MTFFRSFILNFLIVFFVDRVVPGIEITYFEQLPDIGADLLFSIALGGLNASIFPVLSCTEFKVSRIKQRVISGVVSFSPFGLIALIPFGIKVLNGAGFFLGGTIVWALSYISNYLEWKRAPNS